MMFQVDPNNFGGWLKRRQSYRPQPASVLAGEERRISQAPNTLCCENGIAQIARKAPFVPTKKCTMTGREG